MKRRSFLSFLAVGVVVLLLTGIGGYYWLVRESPLTLLRGGTQATPAAAMFVPKQAPVMVSMLVNPDRLEGLAQVVGSTRGRERIADQLKTNLQAYTGLNYRQDIQPWLGAEITLAVTTSDIDRNDENGRQPGYLMALATQDADRSREFLELLFSKRALAGKNLAFEQYKGVKLIYDNPRSQIDNQNAVDSKSAKREGTPLAGTVVGDRFILFANHPKVLRDAINNIQADDLNLISSSLYQQALTLLPSRRIGVIFLNLPSVAAWQGLKLQHKTYENQIIALELNRQGLLAETSLLAAPDQEIFPPAPTLSQPVAALQYIPSATSFSISGSDLSRLGNTDLNQLWAQTSATLSGGSGDDAISRLISQPLAALEARWGIDLPQDIFSWVQGEYALGRLPHAEQSTSDWIFVAQKSAAALQGISRLDAIASQSGLSISSLPLGNQKVSAWTELVTAPASAADLDRSSITLKAKVRGVHTTVGNYEILTSSVEAMDAALKAPQGGSLVNNPQFQASIKAVPLPNEGYFYLDWTENQKTLEHQLPILKLLEVVGLPFLSNLRSLTTSTYGSETGVLKGAMVFRFDAPE